MPKGNLTTVADLVAEPLYEMTAEKLVRFIVRTVEESRGLAKVQHVLAIGLCHASSVDNSEEIMRQWRIDSAWHGEQLVEEAHRIGGDSWNAAKDDCRIFSLPQAYKILSLDSKSLTFESWRFEIQPPASKAMNSVEGADYRGQAATAQRSNEFTQRLTWEKEQYTFDFLANQLAHLTTRNRELELRVETLLREKDQWLDGTHRREHESKQADRDANSAEQFVNLLKDQVLPLLAEKYGATAKLKRFAESLGPEQAMAFSSFTSEQFDMLKEISPQITETIMDRVQQRLTLSQEAPKNGV